MAVISEVKCGRCDRRYSGFRSRCPYCGARRNKRGKHAEETENKKASMIIGSLLLLVLIGATIVLIIANSPGTSGDTAAKSSASASVKPTIDEQQITSVSGSASPAVSPSPSPSPSVDPNVKISKIVITYNGVTATDVTMGKIGDTLQFKYQTTPVTTNKVPIWSSSDKNVFFVDANGKVIANGKGTATLTVTIDNVPATCIIRVRGS